MEPLLCRMTCAKMEAIGWIEFFYHPRRLQKGCFEKNVYKVFISDFS